MAQGVTTKVGRLCIVKSTKPRKSSVTTPKGKDRNLRHWNPKGEPFVKRIMINEYGHITHVAIVPLAKMRMKGFAKVQYSCFTKIKVNEGISCQYVIKLCHIALHTIII